MRKFVIYPIGINFTIRVGIICGLPSRRGPRLAPASRLDSGQIARQGSGDARVDAGNRAGIRGMIASGR